jgi:hypothetical protein
MDRAFIRGGHRNLLVRKSRGDRIDRTGRAALCMDCTCHGGHRRLGHAAPVWPAVVSEADSLLLGGGHGISPAFAGGVGGATAFRLRRTGGSADACVARKKTLRRRHEFPFLPGIARTAAFRDFSRRALRRSHSRARLRQICFSARRSGRRWRARQACFVAQGCFAQRMAWKRLRRAVILCRCFCLVCSWA